MPRKSDNDRVVNASFTVREWKIAARRFERSIRLDVLEKKRSNPWKHLAEALHTLQRMRDSGMTKKFSGTGLLGKPPAPVYNTAMPKKRESQ